MPCYHPIEAWYAKKPNEGGKHSLVFNRTLAHPTKKQIEIGCGQCIGCRLEKSRQWATRCLHEASEHTENCFITLTYSDEGLKLRENEYIKTNIQRAKQGKDPLDVPHNYTIATRDYQLFMKRLRKNLKKQIRFYQCGEYGETCITCKKSAHYCTCNHFIPELGRPHYHAILFGHQFTDLVPEGTNAQGDTIYSSETLKKSWPYGNNIIGDVTFESAAYVARYVMKKITGNKELAYYHYQKFDENGEIIHLKPEYTTMSRGGKNGTGIAHDWYKKYKRDLYPSDFITVNGKKCRVPKYYDAQLEKFEPELYKQIKLKRENSIDKSHPDLTDDRLKAREKCITLKLNQLTRKV